MKRRSNKNRFGNYRGEHIGIDKMKMMSTSAERCSATGDENGRFALNTACFLSNLSIGDSNR
ncbi:hypothetical protein NECAME_04434 [Necator americanus]|uniref:Uncharacterized protein n=1 Tax=Necator americanus TaxID=51031 RepID=W2ST90_NECAM|nr:hypothetical protein NECAME_04434 [Necator americanus]ETN72825.1 hypothetical protein NECAME_04434 [Necator americanus]